MGIWKVMGPSLFVTETLQFKAVLFYKKAPYLGTTSCGGRYIQIESINMNPKNSTNLKSSTITQNVHTLCTVVI